MKNKCFVMLSKVYLNQFTEKFKFIHQIQSKKRIQEDAKKEINKN